MSSTGRAADREVNDDYPSPRWTVHRLLEAIQLPSGIWVEPCAGAGSIIRAVNQVRSDVRWIANELNPRYMPALRSIPNVVVASNDNACTLDIGQGPSVIITNPPFVHATQILIQCLEVKTALTIFLERLNWCGGPRAELFRLLKPSVFVLPDRPSFKEKKRIDKKTGKEKVSTTDSIEYGWFVFDGLGRFVMLADTPNEARLAEKMERRVAQKLASLSLIGWDEATQALQRVA